MAVSRLNYEPEWYLDYTESFTVCESIAVESNKRSSQITGADSGNRSIKPNISPEKILLENCNGKKSSEPLIEATGNAILSPEADASHNDSDRSELNDSSSDPNVLFENKLSGRLHRK